MESGFRQSAASRRDRIVQVLRRLLTGTARDPLFHFLLIGAAIFVAYSAIDKHLMQSHGDSGSVLVTANEVEWLQKSWARQWQRAPTGEELKDVVADYIREKLLAREARALGLDDNDTVVQRRLAQKMDFIVQDTTQRADPGDEELRRYYESNRERFDSPERVSFIHVYFSRERRGGAAKADALASLGQLNRARVIDSNAGDRFLGEYRFDEIDQRSVAGLFGSRFAEQAFGIHAGAWQGPIESEYGWHLVRVTKKESPRPKPFLDMRAQILALWREEQEEVGRRDYLAALAEKYPVVADESIRPLVESVPFVRWGAQ